MKITPQLTAHLVSLGALATGANEQATKDAAADCLADGRLTSAKYKELAKEPEAEEAEDLTSLLKTVKDRLGSPVPAATAEATGSKLPRNLSGLLAAGDDDTEHKGSNPRVKGAWEQYDRTKRALSFPMDVNSRGMKHRLAGQPFHEGEGANRRVIDEPSQLDKAVVGAYLKYQMRVNTRTLDSLNDHEKDLLNYGLRNYAWGGIIGHGGSPHGENAGAIHVKNRLLQKNEWEKALIDDSTSGGLEAAPIVFDDMIITTPLLYGEFYPNVNVVPITRGRRIEGASFGIPTLQSGGSDNDNIDLFTTTAFVAAFDTTIFVCDGGFEVGLDFLSDSPVDVTSVIVDGYSRQLLAWLDEQICIGDGTTEPEGITVASGTTSVSGGSAAPTTVGVYESFFFGVAKRFKQGYSNDRMQFGASETTYMRARAIAVGASDARRIFGMTHGDYMLMGHKYGISDQMANTKAFFANMARYRMYRRLGMTIKATTEGETLTRKNLMFISCRSRWGGHLELGGAAAVSSTMQA